MGFLGNINIFGGAGEKEMANEGDVKSVEKRAEAFPALKVTAVEKDMLFRDTPAFLNNSGWTGTLAELKGKTGEEIDALFPGLPEHAVLLSPKDTSGNMKVPGLMRGKDANGKVSYEDTSVPLNEVPNTMVGIYYIVEKA